MSKDYSINDLVQTRSEDALTNSERVVFNPDNICFLFTPTHETDVWVDGVFSSAGAIFEKWEKN